MTKEKWISFAFVMALIVSASVGYGARPAQAADYSNSNLMDDAVFDNLGSMSESQIQSFLSGQDGRLSSGSACLGSYTDVNFHWDGSNWHYGDNTMSANGTLESSPWNTSWGPAMIPASVVIYQAAQQWGFNPEVIIATLEKEETLVTSTSCSNSQYWSAMGYNCPDAGGQYSYPSVGVTGPTCVSNIRYVGFSRQVLWGSWQLKFNKERSLGNTAWDGDGDIVYGGDMTQGTFSQCADTTACPPTTFSGYATIDGQNIYLDDGATASLYTYTPHLNQAFPGIFEQWFGSVLAVNTTNLAMTTVTAPDPTPAVGETITYKVSFTNNLSTPITVSGLGIVGRLGSLTGANRDFGWLGQTTFAANSTQSYTFTTTISDLGSIYFWPAMQFNGSYIQYNNWGTEVTSHVPNLGISTPLTTSVPSPMAGQSVTLSATVKNLESHAVTLSNLGIPVRFYGSYNYDVGWSDAPVTIAAGATQTVSGSVVFDKAGPYTAWVSAYETSGQFMSLSPSLNMTTAPVTPNFVLGYTQTPDTHPAEGETITESFTLKNMNPVPITVAAVGVAGRYDSQTSSTNEDLGWQGPVTFAAGQQNTYTFTKTISALNNLYTWVAVEFNGSFTQYTPWGFEMTPHVPNITISSPITINGGSAPTLGQSTPVTVTVKNNEPNPIHYDALGIPILFYSRWHYDAAWLGSGTLAASGQSGDTQVITGSTTFDKHGPYTIWASVFLGGQYLTIGTPYQLQM